MQLLGLLLPNLFTAETPNASQSMTLTAAAYNDLVSTFTTRLT